MRCTAILFIVRGKLFGLEERKVVDSFRAHLLRDYIQMAMHTRIEIAMLPNKKKQKQQKLVQMIVWGI